MNAWNDWLLKFKKIKKEAFRYFKKIIEFGENPTPVYLQMQTEECGAAALGIILEYYGRYIPLEELRVSCGVSRDGSKAINMIKAARNYGLKAYGARGEIEDLKTLKLPVVVFWQFNHFVVVEEIQEEEIYINDPASGRRTVTPHEFNRSFTGIILIFEPGPHFQPGGHRPNILESLKERLQGSKRTIGFLVLASLAFIFPGIIIPGFSKIFIDDILVKGIKNWLPLLLVGLLLTALLRGIISWLQNYHFLRFHIKIMLSSSAKLVSHIFRLPIVFFEQRYIGDLEDRIESNDRIASLISTDISGSVVGILTIFFYAIVMFLYDWSLTLIGITAVALNATLLYLVSKKLFTSSLIYLQESGKLSGVELSGIAAIETIQSSSLDNHFFQRLTGQHAAVIQTEQKIKLYHQALSTLPQIVSGLMTVFILGLGSLRIIKGDLSVGTLVAFQSLLMSFTEPVNTLLNVGTKIQEIKGDFTRMDDVMHHHEEPRLQIRASQKTSTKITSHALQMNNISFGYSELDPPFIQDFSFVLPKGGQVALVGATGSGKSTIIKLLTGLYTPWSGDINIMGNALSTFSQQELSHLLALVDQEILLFEGSIRDNLTLWDESIKEDEIIEACQTALIWETIKQREKLLESLLEPNGKNLSGGERQRLEIARALLQRPSILIMDEGTSALDNITEQKLMTHLKKQGFSLLLVTHRLSTIQSSDEIIVLEKGSVIERGTHQSLMKEGGKYVELMRMQNEGLGEGQ